MDQDRNSWGAREYAIALNDAATPADLFELVREVNQKWSCGCDEPRPELQATHSAK